LNWLSYPLESPWLVQRMMFPCSSPDINGQLEER
jgi:hypothetical protein